MKGSNFMKKKCVIIILIITALMPYSNINATEKYAVDNNAKEDIEAYADIKEWRYKIMDGYLYKRLYNVSKGKWEGPWIKVYE